MENDFLAFIASVMKVNTEDISMETTYGEYASWDSLMMITLIMETEAEYGVFIPIEKVGQIRTLKDLYQLTKG